MDTFLSQVFVALEQIVALSRVVARKKFNEADYEHEYGLMKRNILQLIWGACNVKYSLQFKAWVGAQYLRKFWNLSS